jgi:hypothetical protein
MRAASLPRHDLLGGSHSLKDQPSEGSVEAESPWRFGRLGVRRDNCIALTNHGVPVSR